MASRAARLLARVCRRAVIWGAFPPPSPASSSSSNADRRYATRRAVTSLCASQLNGTSNRVLSSPSGPWMAAKTRAQSSAERHMGPILSMVQLRVIPPYRLTRPKVGRRPVTPLRVEGEMIDPRVSVPMENPTRPAAVAAPGPADEPLEPCSVFQGLRVRPPNQRSPDARAPMVSLATRMAPASARRR